MPVDRKLISGVAVGVLRWSQYNESDESDESDEFKLFLRTTTLGDALNELPSDDDGADMLREAASQRGNGGPLSAQLPLSVALGYVPQSQLREVMNSLYCLMLRR